MNNIYSLSEQHLKQYKHFHKKADDLKEEFNQTLVGNMKYTIDVHSNDWGREKFTGAPSKQSLRSLSSVLRQFIAEKENINFNRVGNSIGRYLDQDKQEIFNSSKKIWNNLLSKDNYEILEGLNISLQGEYLSNYRMIDLWFNGEIFHTDIQDGKAEKFQELMDKPGGVLLHFAFVDFLQKLSIIVMKTDDQVVVPLLNEVNQANYE